MDRSNYWNILRLWKRLMDNLGFRLQNHPHFLTWCSPMLLQIENLKLIYCQYHLQKQLNQGHNLSHLLPYSNRHCELCYETFLVSSRYAWECSSQEFLLSYTLSHMHCTTLASQVVHFAKGECLFHFIICNQYIESYIEWTRKRSWYRFVCVSSSSSEGK